MVKKSMVMERHTRRRWSRMADTIFCARCKRVMLFTDDMADLEEWLCEECRNTEVCLEEIASTQETVRFVEGCSECGKESVNWDDVDTSLEEFSFTYTCEDCGKVWTERYKIYHNEHNQLEDGVMIPSYLWKEYGMEVV